jgi:four helix bundle protein
MNSEPRAQNLELRKEYEHDIYPRVFEFACSVVRLHRAMVKRPGADRIAANQLLRAGTSVGANLEEARGGQSRADFVAKARISLKEAREAHYWLRLAEATDMVPVAEIHPLVKEANEIVAVLTTIIKNTTNHKEAPIS